MEKLKIYTYLCIEAELLGEFCSKFLKLKDDLQKNGRHDLKNERKSVPSTVPKPLTYALIHLSAFWSVVGYLPGENWILLNFSSLSMVAILVCETYRQVGSSNFPIDIPIVIQKNYLHGKERS